MYTHINLLFNTVMLIILESESGSQVNGTCSDNCTCFNTSSSSGWAGDTVCGCLPGYKLQTIDGVNATCQGININCRSFDRLSHYFLYIIIRALLIWMYTMSYKIMTNGCAEDINECSDSSLCNGTCENTIGSYNCYCPSGYMLNSNGSLCVGMVDHEFRKN